MLRRVAFWICAFVTLYFGVAGILGVVNGEVRPVGLVFVIPIVVTALRVFKGLDNDPA